MAKSKLEEAFDLLQQLHDLLGVDNSCPRYVCVLYAQLYNTMKEWQQTAPKCMICSKSIIHMLPEEQPEFLHQNCDESSNEVLF